MMPEIQSDWNSMIAALPGTHFLQTEEWAEVKSKVGWKKQHLTWKDESGQINAAAQVLIRETRAIRGLIKLRVGYVPRGPLMDWRKTELRIRVLDDLAAFAKKEGLIFLKVDPEVKLGRGLPDETGQDQNLFGNALEREFSRKGWKYSPEQVQFKNTVMLDLSGTEDDWLARMKQKTRYNLRLAQRSGVVVRRTTADDLPALYKLYAETAARDGFIIRPEDYYLDVWRKFQDHGLCTGLAAEVQGELVAGLMLFHFGNRAWYVYGMSSNNHREKMPNYLLQWEAMRTAREKGCLDYDLWGAPDTFDGKDSMAGVFRFKEGLGGELIRTIGAWDLPVQPFFYVLYQGVLPKILEITRRIRRRQLKREVV